MADEEDEILPDMTDDMHNERLRQGLLQFWHQQLQVSTFLLFYFY